MFKLIEYSNDLDLTDFYIEATKRGFTNNSSRHMLVDCFSNEERYCVWILYYNDIVVGSVACHTLDIIPNSYRICARTCVFTDKTPYHQLRGLNYTIKQHQNITAQFYIPKCIEWANSDNLYISSHNSSVGTQRLVHNIYCPALYSTGCIDYSVEHEYRGHMQTFWKLNVNVFNKQLNELPRWN
jgi:hypothetical protein